MADGLDVATNLLNSALERYFRACSNLKVHYLPGAGFAPELANRVLEELLLLTSYENEIQQSKAIISRLNNYSGSTSARSINSLPAEVLTRIFGMVCNMHPCPRSTTYALLSSYKPPTLAIDPIILSHVCSLWRQIIVGSAEIWSHIDLVPNQFRVPSLLERANTYMARSGQAPLEIHIVESPGKDYLEEDDEIEACFDLSWPDPNFLEFLTAMAPRIRSLTMSVGHPPTQGTFCHSILSTCFANCVPGQLSRLSLRAARDIHARPGSNIDTTLVGLPKETVEALWHPIKSLQLDKFYPNWSSKAYHGLVELDLAGDGSIPESGLIAILKSSPGLRVFKISLNITHLTPRDAPIEPVPLVDLEQLSPSPGRERQVGYILRLIAPGTKPLGLTLVNPWLGSTRERPTKFTSRDETRKFFARSNVTRFYACNFDTYQQLANVLSMAPSVRVLALDGCRCRQVPEESDLPPDFTLDELYVIRSTESEAVTWPSIERIVEKHRIRKLTLWWYDFRHNGLGQRGETVVPDNLYTVCPVVNVVSNESPNPIEDWE